VYEEEQYAEDPNIHNSESAYAIEIIVSAKVVEKNYQHSHASQQIEIRGNA
jgi:hypothetical protein